jgi:starch-binding outer membrane protein, SusD/RagB family
MNKIFKYPIAFISILAAIMYLTSCEDFFNPKQELNINESDLYKDWYEYRAIEMGMYGLQQKLVEQLLILGELRGDLLTITPNAEADMVEVYNFNISKTNKYASPTNFFKLIAASNNLLRELKKRHPEVLDPKSTVNNYDRLYGEALCMRAWAYFNAVRIYGKVPFIPESLITMDEIENFVNSPGTYIDSVYISYSSNGYYNDTVYNKPITLEKNYFDEEMVIDHFTADLNKNVKAVGVNHHLDNGDITWEVTIWNDFAMHSLLGVMYLTRGDLAQAHDEFSFVMDNTSTNNRYKIDNTFGRENWRNIFTSIDSKEHIYTIWFNKDYFQQNQFQDFFEDWASHKYMLKPSAPAIFKWETVWKYQAMQEGATPGLTRMLFPGLPGDYYRGYMSSYLYLKNGGAIPFEEWRYMLDLKANGDDRSANAIMEGAEPIVYKYSINKDPYDQDANYIVYRAAGIHLYMAEVYTCWAQYDNGSVKTNRGKATGIINDGSYYSLSPSRPQVGVRGRIDLNTHTIQIDGNYYTCHDEIRINNIIYNHDPYTNKLLGYTDLAGDDVASQQWLEEQLLDEKARELAFEGERFYDLMRLAKRRGDPSFLAQIVSSKYPEGERDRIYNLLLNEENWYINYFK